ncbi:MAG: hypothetical protein Q4P36_08520 [Bowdeniella nasicola]|nr:hypothetical protein [Bowdeniella nasicola]
MTEERASVISRRTVIKGGTWAIPAVTVATAVPAYAASYCTAGNQAQIAAALETFVVDSLEINFYQAVYSINGGTGFSVVNVKNISGQSLTFEEENPLTLRIDAVDITGNRQRNLTGSDLGQTVQDLGYDEARRTRTFIWQLRTTLAPGAEPDFRFAWGRTWGTVKSKVVVTPVLAIPKEAELSSILPTGDASACAEHYQQALNDAKHRQFRYRGPQGEGRLKSGQGVDSSVIGDYFSGNNPGDGIY